MKFSFLSLAALGMVLGPSLVTAEDLNIVVRGNPMVIPNNQVDYDQNRNVATSQNVSVTSGGFSAILDGTLWKAFKLPTPITVEDDTVLKFRFSLSEEANFQGICLEEDLEHNSDGKKRCFLPAGTQSSVSNKIKLIDQTTLNENEKEYAIPVGHFYQGEMKYLAFFQKNDANHTLGLAEFSDIEIYDYQNGGLAMTVDGTSVNVPNAPQLDYYISNPFDQDTHEYFLDVSEDGSSVQIVGNQWKSLELPGDGIDIVEGTTLEFEFSLQEKKDFHAICLDEDQRVVQSAIRCFILANTQTNINNFYLMEKKTPEGGTVSYSIPLWMYYSGNVKYLAFVQDNDTSNKSTGSMTFRDITVNTVPQYDLTIEVGGMPMNLAANPQIAYENNQDSKEHPMVVSSDGLNIHLEGNSWKALQFPTPVEVNYATELDFDFTLGVLGEIHSICLDVDLDHGDHRCCFAVANTEIFSQFHDWQPKTEVGETRHYNIPVGTKCPLLGNMTYLVFIQDNDADKTAGSSTFSNIVISERPELNVNINGVDTPIFNHQKSYDQNQDFPNSLMEVSEDGSSITMRGNHWKAMAFPENSRPTISDNTVLAFDVSIEEITDFAAICLDDDLEMSNGARCFRVGGTQEGNFGNLIYQGIDETHEGESGSYLIRLDEFFSGPIEYLVLLNDNDSDDRTTGISTFSNIRIFEAQSCLKDKTLPPFSLDECTADAFVSKIGDFMTQFSCPGDDPWAELLALFGVSLLSDVKDKIGDICTLAYSADALPFDHVTGQEHQFTAEYLDGGTIWNYKVGDPEKDAGRVAVIEANYENQAISWPHVHNFQGCELHAAMCCFVASRTSLDVTDNSDACYMDFRRAQQSSHVRDGYSLYLPVGESVEGSLNCHGFAWDSDKGSAASALKGNSLFDIAMRNELYTNHNVEELPGAPLCGCVEQMPVVTKAACTKVVAQQSVEVTYIAGQFFAEADITSISYSDCGDLKQYYGGLVSEGKATERELAMLDKYLVGEGQCGAAIGSFLESKGLMLMN